MKKIFTDFIEGDSTKKLSIISDFATILGVSVATFVAGPFMSKFAGIDFILSDFIFAVVFYFFWVCIVFGGVYEFVLKIHTDIKSKAYEGIVSRILLALVILWVLIWVYPASKYILGNSFGVSYLLPTMASKAVKSVSPINIEELKSKSRVSGVVTFIEGVDPKDYVVVAYIEDDDGRFVVVRFDSAYNADYEGEINSDGEFKFPVQIPKETKEKLHFVIYRKSDWSTLTAIGGDPGYPDHVTQIPDRDIDEVGAYVLPNNN